MAPLTSHTWERNTAGSLSNASSRNKLQTDQMLPAGKVKL